MEDFIVHRKQIVCLTALTFAAVLVFAARNGVRAQQPGTATAAPVGIFESHGDVGTVLHPGTAEYDAAAEGNTMAGGGKNRWFAMMRSSSRGRRCPAT